MRTVVTLVAILLCGPIVVRAQNTLNGTITINYNLLTSCTLTVINNVESFSVYKPWSGTRTVSCTGSGLGAGESAQCASFSVNGVDVESASASASVSISTPAGVTYNNNQPVVLGLSNCNGTSCSFSVETRGSVTVSSTAPVGMFTGIGTLTITCNGN